MTAKELLNVLINNPQTWDSEIEVVMREVSEIHTEITGGTSWPTVAIIVPDPNKSDKAQEESAATIAWMEVVDNALRDFKVSKVQEVMKTLKWTWQTKDGFRLPLTKEISACARKLAWDAINGLIREGVDHYEASTGGLRVQAWIDKDAPEDPYHLAIEFIAVETER